MGWFVGMVCLPLLYKHAEFLSEHDWVPYIILCAFAIAGGIIIICIQKVYICSILAACLKVFLMLFLVC